MESPNRELSFADLRLGGNGGAKSIFLQVAFHFNKSLFIIKESEFLFFKVNNLCYDIQILSTKY